MVVLLLLAGLFRFQQNKPAPEPLFHIPPTCARIPDPCEAATDVGVAVRRGIVHVKAEQARAGAIIPCSADVAPSSQFLARRQPISVLLCDAG